MAVRTPLTPAPMTATRTPPFVSFVMLGPSLKGWSRAPPRLRGVGLPSSKTRTCRARMWRSRPGLQPAARGRGCARAGPRGARGRSRTSSSARVIGPRLVSWTTRTGTVLVARGGPPARCPRAGCRRGRGSAARPCCRPAPTWYSWSQDPGPGRGPRCRAAGSPRRGTRRRRRGRAGRRPRPALPTCSMRPPFITTTRSASSSASSWSWVTKTWSAPISSCSRRSQRRSSLRTLASSAPNGSSSSSTRGSIASARASATRWRWPPESWDG